MTSLCDVEERSTGGAESATKVAQAERALTQRHGRRPSLEEVAREAGVSETAVAELRRAALAPVSISEPHGVDEHDFDNLICDDADADPALRLANGAGASHIASALSGLDARGRRILELRYGFDGQAPRTLTEVADELGVSSRRSASAWQRSTVALSP